MAGSISGLGTTYGLPNYTGELFNLSPVDHPFLTMAGGLSGGGQVEDYEFEWETSDLRAATANNVVLEGQDAPTATGRVRANVTNVTEIHHSAINISYTKLAAFQRKSGVNNNAMNPITDELSWQVNQELTSMARDVNASFLRGAYQKPTDNSTSRKTQGIIGAITTNKVDAAAGVTLPAWSVAGTSTITSTAHGMSTGATWIPTTLAANVTEVVVDTSYYVTVLTANTFTVSATKGGSAITFAGTGGSGASVAGVVITDDLISATLQSVYDNSGLTESETFTLFCNSWNKTRLSRIYLKSYGAGFFPQSRTVGGVNVDTIVTDFGTLNIVMDRQMPKHKILMASMNEVAPVFTEVPGKGHLFVEPLAKTGAQEKVQLYGEVGLKYGAQQHHGLLINTTIW